MSSNTNNNTGVANITHLQREQDVLLRRIMENEGGIARMLLIAIVFILKLIQVR